MMNNVNWRDLSDRDKASWVKFAIDNGITNTQLFIQNNTFAEGGEPNQALSDLFVYSPDMYKRSNQLKLRDFNFLLTLLGAYNYGNYNMNPLTVQQFNSNYAPYTKDNFRAAVDNLKGKLNLGEYANNLINYYGTNGMSDDEYNSIVNNYMDWMKTNNQGVNEQGTNDMLLGARNISTSVTPTFSEIYRNLVGGFAPDGRFKINRYRSSMDTNLLTANDKDAYSVVDTLSSNDLRNNKDIEAAREFLGNDSIRVDPATNELVSLNGGRSRVSNGKTDYTWTVSPRADWNMGDQSGQHYNSFVNALSPLRVNTRAEGGPLETYNKSIELGRLNLTLVGADVLKEAIINNKLNKINKHSDDTSKLIGDTTSYDIDIEAIPYIKEKEIRVTSPNKQVHLTKLPTNALDTIAKYAIKTDTPLDLAFGLPMQESNYGSGYISQLTREDYGIDPKEMLSAWDYKNNESKEMRQIKGNIYDNYDMLRAYADEMSDLEIQDVLDENKELVNKYISRSKAYNKNFDPNLNVYEWAFDYLKQGKYNPGDPDYMNKVRSSGRALMESPLFKKYWKTSEYNPENKKKKK